MNTAMRKRFGNIPNTKVFEGICWGERGVFVELNLHAFAVEDFMKPTHEAVSSLLKEGFIVVVYNGQLDIVCNTLGVVFLFP